MGLSYFVILKLVFYQMHKFNKDNIGEINSKQRTRFVVIYLQMPITQSGGYQFLFIY